MHETGIAEDVPSDQISLKSVVSMANVSRQSTRSRYYGQVKRPAPMPGNYHFGFSDHAYPLHYLAGSVHGKRHVLWTQRINGWRNNIAAS